MRRFLFVFFVVVVAVPLSYFLGPASFGAAIYFGFKLEPGMLVARWLYPQDSLQNLGGRLEIVWLVDSFLWFVLIVGMAMWLRARWMRKNQAGGSRS
jgi:hypothetical protein